MPTVILAFMPQKERWRAEEEVERAKHEHRGFWGSVNTEKLFAFSSEGKTFSEPTMPSNGASMAALSFVVLFIDQVLQQKRFFLSDLRRCLYTNLDYWWLSDHLYFLYFIYLFLSITSYWMWCQIDFLFLHSCFKTKPLLATISSGKTCL